MLLILLALAGLNQSTAQSSGSDHKTRRLSDSLPRDLTLSSLRLSFSCLVGHFSVPEESQLLEAFNPVTDFYSSALKTQKLLNPLHPQDFCEDFPVPESDIEQGIQTDVHIYIATLIDKAFDIKSDICLRDGGIFARPLIGIIKLGPEFFSLPQAKQTLMLLRESGRILAFSESNTKEFVKSNGSKYSNSQYMTLINYPYRGKAVKALGFPKMLEKARVAFNCSIEGLELEDFSENHSYGYFWDSRTMPHDIMSSYLSDDVVFSDITLAIFEDSGWYQADYSYSSSIYWGKNAGCDWFGKQCLENGIATLPGFCDTSAKDVECDAFNLGYGDCLVSHSNSILPHEEYFKDSTLGGDPLFDYCPIVKIPLFSQCRSPFGLNNYFIGESRDLNSRCLMSSLILGQPKDNKLTVRGGCYNISMCGAQSISVTVGNVTVQCPYGGHVAVQGYSGELQCPKSKEFCSNLPCANMCMGRGKCLNGACKCNEGYGGADCSIKCQSSCKNCGDLAQACTSCYDGYYLTNSSCSKCELLCKTCSESPTTCTSCYPDYQLSDNICKASCIDHCSTCDNPCTTCDAGYYLSSNTCKECKKGCTFCKDTEDNCLHCASGFTLHGTECIPDCVAGCTTCDYPCPSCQSGFFLSSGLCEYCDNLCKTCISSSSTCTSCFSGYGLKGSTCVGGCADNCLSCDSPCSVCEDGYLSVNGICEKCDKNCLTCQSSLSTCTTCHQGFTLNGATCKSDCVDKCKICTTTCEECEDGFVAEYGLCIPCDPMCATCKHSAILCNSCPPDHGLIMNSCVSGCSNNCLSCNNPCTICEAGYYVSGGLCKKCYENCETCAGFAKGCTKCRPGFILSGSVCIEGCNQQCLSCDEPCTTCEEGYYSYKLGCSPCQSNCKTCATASNSCTSCFENYGLVASRCQPKCLDHCSSCDKPCTTCEPGFFSNGETGCALCPINCKACISATVCTACAEGFKLEGQVCVKACVDNCITCDKPCLECNLGYVAIEGRCEACSPNCNMCTEALYCYYCQKGYELKGSSCAKVCDPLCKSCDTPCAECVEGATLIEGRCTMCEVPCLTCSKSALSCSSCPEKYRLSGTTCIPECLPYCNSCDNPCSECEVGYVAVSGVCQKCSGNCKTCAGHPEICTTCFEGEDLIENSCQPKCIENCSNCDVPCRICKQNFILTNGNCLPCKSFIRSEMVSAKFSDDFSSISIYFNVPINNRSKSCVDYIQSESLEKLGKNYQCYWETEMNLHIILGEKPDYSIESIELYPIESENEICVLEPEKLSARVIGNKVSKPIISLVLPNYFSLACNEGFLTVQGITEEVKFGFLIDSVNIDSSIKTLIMPISHLKASVLNITFYATNKLGLTSYTSKSIEIITNFIPSVTIDAGDYIRMQTIKNFTIRGQMSQNSCVKIEDYSFRWKYIEIDSEKKINAEKIIKQSALPHMLVIRSGQLPAGKSYVFRFEAYNNSTFAFSDIEIEAVESEIVLIIDRNGGSFNFKDPLVISAAQSYDPDYPEASLSYNWECRYEGNSCLDKIGQPVILNELAPILRINANLFQINVTIELMIKVFSGKKSIQKSLFFTSSDSEGYISISNLPILINPDREFAVFPKFMYDEGSPEFLWTQTFGLPVQPITMNTSEILVILSHGLIQGHGYSFELSMTINNKTAYAETSWETNTGPTCNNLASKLYETNAVLYIDCFEKNLLNLPLKYEYGVIIKGKLAPLKVSNSANFILKLNSGIWNTYVKVCDILNTCNKYESVIEIKTRELKSNSSDFNTQKMFPDYLPVAIWNNAETFTASNFVGAFNDLVAFIRAQDIDKVHLTMALMSLEILTASNKSHFMWNHQEEILMFLAEIVEKIPSIDNEDMEDFVNMISEHNVKNYDVTTRAISVFSEKWMTNSPPNKQKNVSSNIQVLRNRVVGKDLNSNYTIGNIFVKSLNMKYSNSEIYDILTIVYPEKPSQVLQIQIFKVGDFIKHSISFNSQVLITSDPSSPILIEISGLKPIDYDCLQYLHSTWVEEGCQSSSSGNKLHLLIWHLHPFKLVASGLFTVGFQALSCLCFMLGLCIFTVSIFCAIDKSKSKYMPEPYFSEVKQAESPRNFSEEEKFNLPDLKDSVRDTCRSNTHALSLSEYNKNVDPSESPVPEVQFDNKVEIVVPTPSSSVEVTITKIPFFMYHPSLNLRESQNGDRRAASALHLFAVVFMEFLCVGGLVNYNWNHIYNDEGEFVGFSYKQVETFALGMIFTQLISFILMILNKVNDLSVTKRYLGMGLCCFIIAVCSGAVITLTLNYPSRYSLLWVKIFSICFLAEIIVLQNFMWGINVLIFKQRKVFDNAGSARIFTTES